MNVSLGQSAARLSNGNSPSRTFGGSRDGVRKDPQRPQYERERGERERSGKQMPASHVVRDRPPTTFCLWGL